MSTHPSEKLVVRETGWSKARHQRGQDMRTCVPAVEADDTEPAAEAGREAKAATIVRGDD
ncbi:hypothetical protein AB0L99_39045 [Streptomyces sp. NPDC051954]|uniref:hypothetical protein n=1 Tax=unclassified Streptomyces TaxID=2593676 RepID=UPI003413E266